MPVRVKICGLKSPAALDAAVAGGAAYVGFNFFERSPRYVPPQAAQQLALAVPAGIAKVGLVVDADNAALEAILATVPLDMLQLHGTEPPGRVADIRRRFGLPVMKALGVATAEDLDAVADFAPAADQLLIDAKPPQAAALPGGNGLAFDWRLIAGQRWPVPWMLAGGLNAENVAEAIALTGAAQVDVASGVERAPGEKDPERISEFMRAAAGR